MSVAGESALTEARRSSSTVTSTEAPSETRVSITGISESMTSIAGSVESPAVPSRAVTACRSFSTMITRAAESSMIQRTCSALEES